MGNEATKDGKNFEETFKAMELKKNIMRSVKQSGVDFSVLMKAQNGKWTEDTKLKSFYFYYLMDKGILRPELISTHDINKQKAQEYLEFLGNDNKQKVKEVVDKCDPENTVSVAERPFRFCKCLQQNGMPIDVLKKSSKKT